MTYRCVGIEVTVTETEDGLRFSLPDEQMQDYHDDLNTLGMALVVAEARYQWMEQ